MLTAAAGDPEAAKRMGAAARLIVAPLTWEATGSTTAALLDRALQRAAAGP
jgi:hypothetical protein